MASWAICSLSLFGAFKVIYLESQGHKCDGEDEDELDYMVELELACED